MAARLDRVFAALADPTRRALLERLTAAPATVTELAAPFGVSLNAVSKHLKVLERAGLIGRQVLGREHHCHLRGEALDEATAWIDHNRGAWETRLQALDAMLRARRRARPPEPERP